MMCVECIGVAGIVAGWLWHVWQVHIKGVWYSLQGWAR